MTTQLPRVFKYNSVELEDPGPEHDPVDVRNLYSATYPEIVSAAIEGPEVKDGKRVYTFRKAVGTKGNDRERGVYDKYHVERLNDPAGKHKDCSFFVLDLVHDKYAADALGAYATACRNEFPKLAEELYVLHDQIRQRHGL